MVLTLRLLDDTYTWSSHPPDWQMSADLRASVMDVDFWAVTGDSSEVTTVFPSRLSSGGTQSDGWRVLEVVGVLTHDLVGITVAVCEPMQKVGVSVMPMAAHRTDYVGFSCDGLLRAVSALLDAGFDVQGGPADVAYLASHDVHLG